MAEVSNRRESKRGHPPSAVQVLIAVRPMASTWSAWPGRRRAAKPAEALAAIRVATTRNQQTTGGERKVISDW